MEAIRAILEIAFRFKGEELRFVWNLLGYIAGGLLHMLCGLPAFFWFWMLPGIMTALWLVGIAYALVCNEDKLWTRLLVGFGTLVGGWVYWNILAASIVYWEYPLVLAAHSPLWAAFWQLPLGLIMDTAIFLILFIAWLPFSHLEAGEDKAKEDAE